mgnify:CR=1 FL=1
MHQNIIECNNLTKIFPLSGRDKGATVLDDLSFNVKATEYVIVSGPSGSGKSSLLNLIAGLESPTSGTIKIRGKDITKLDKKEIAHYHRVKVGMVFQQFNLISDLSVIDNIGLPQIFAGDSLDVRHKRAMHLLESLGMGELSDKLPLELSGGEQQRVAILRALANNPWILLVDEPTGNLDSKSAEEVMDILLNLNRKSLRTILMVTHNPEYLHFADRIVYMKDGKIVKEDNHPHRHAKDGSSKTVHRFHTLSEEALEKI